MSDVSVDWKGDDVAKTAALAVRDGLSEFAGRWETAAKGSVKPGRGVVTGTYRRSLHGAGPNYNFARDDVPPTPGTPERGGKATARRQGATISVVCGSGMRYARVLENRYNVVRGAHERVAPQLPAIIERHAVRLGLRK